MEKYISIINQRTFLALGIALLAVFVTVQFDFQYDFDLTMISIAIIFPLVFTIRSAFKRREKALEFLSRFRTGLITVDTSIQQNPRLEITDRAEARTQILTLSERLITYLGPEPMSYDEVRSSAGEITAFVAQRQVQFKTSASLKIHNFMRDVYSGAENTAAIKEHRTPTSIRAYCLIFIYLYPVIYSPSLYYRLSSTLNDFDQWVLYFLCLFSTFILISLFNVQEQLENPFDQKGLDDIRLSKFEIREKDLINLEN
ncbi:hypothetical protein [Algoriphagus namhaensis]